VAWEGEGEGKERGCHVRGASHRERAHRTGAAIAIRNATEKIIRPGPPHPSPSPPLPLPLPSPPAPGGSARLIKRASH